MQQYADIYLLQSYSTCFGCHSTHYLEYWTNQSRSGHVGGEYTSIMTYTGGCGYSF